MKRRPNKVLLAGAALAALGCAAALAQQSPESILPPGFGDPVPSPPAPPPANAPPGRPGDLPSIPLTLPPGLDATGEDGALENEAAIEEPTLSPQEEVLQKYDLPLHARRPSDHVGPYAGAPGLGFAAFGNADGRFLSTLMRALDAPIASRWASILLRRALLSDVPTPRGVAAGDWVAERAWLLLRMGEADAARMLVDSMDIDAMTPKLLSVTAQVALAEGDPAALCPLVDAGEASSREPLWPMARAICVALQGDGGTSAALLDRLRAKRLARGIDLLLAEKVAGAGSGRRAVNIEWNSVDQLTSWRFGLATATGVEVPDRLMATVGPHVAAWRARSPMLSAESRLASARMAAVLGVFSNAALVDLYGAIADATDPTAIQESPAGKLRLAYVGEDDDARIGALHSLWDGAAPGRDRYAAAILTARAAARIEPAGARSGDASALIGAMLSAGYDRAAARWGKVADRLGNGEDAWALLATGMPDPTTTDAARADAWVAAASGERAAKGPLMIAGLAGLGRLPAADAARLAQQAGFALDAGDRWSRAIEAAVRAGQPGTVALLAAVAMQTSDWKGVPPAHFYRLISALRRVGLEGEARMIAAEAIARA